MSFWRKVNGWITDVEREIAEAQSPRPPRSRLGKDDAVALTRAGHALAHFVGDLDSSIALVDRALMLDPNLAAAWFLGGFLRVWRGEPDHAIERFARAMRLSPLDPEMYRMQAGVAMAHLLAGRRTPLDMGREGVPRIADFPDGGRYFGGGTRHRRTDMRRNERCTAYANSTPV